MVYSKKKKKTGKKISIKEDNKNGDLALENGFMKS